MAVSIVGIVNVIGSMLQCHTHARITSSGCSLCQLAAALPSCLLLSVGVLLPQPPTESHPCPGTVMKHGITVCLYFLPPHRVKEVDWFMMEGISSLVAVVPIIAKADTHTAPEMEAYRNEILQVRGQVTYSMLHGACTLTTVIAVLVCWE